MDEVPVYFDMPSKFTLDFQGSFDIRITTTGSNTHTLQLFFAGQQVELNFQLTSFFVAKQFQNSIIPQMSSSRQMKNHV